MVAVSVTECYSTFQVRQPNMDLFDSVPTLQQVQSRRDPLVPQHGYSGKDSKCSLPLRRSQCPEDPVNAISAQLELRIGLQVAQPQAAVCFK